MPRKIKRSKRLVAQVVAVKANKVGKNPVRNQQFDLTSGKKAIVCPLRQKRRPLSRKLSRLRPLKRLNVFAGGFACCKRRRKRRRVKAFAPFRRRHSLIAVLH